MKYLALAVIIACVMFNFIIINKFDKNKISQPVKMKAALTPPVQELPTIAGDTTLLVRTNAAPLQKTNVHRVKSPSFYRGIYLHNYSARVPRVLKRFVRQARKYGVNAFVLDLQDAVYFRTHMLPAANVQYCITNGIYPIARIVVFPYGLKRYPVPGGLLDQRIALAVRAAKAGFPEVQFDYIRFEDSNRLRQVPLHKRFALIEGFLGRAKRVLARYGVKVSADIFGRVTLNRRDPIGQRLEGLDGKVDILCPMVYPSHFSWSRYMMATPYYTVKKTSDISRKRLKKSGVVMYIQGFIMRVHYSGLSLPNYIAHQIKASHDAGIRGYIVWNAAQRYRPTYKGMAMYYSGKRLTGLPEPKRLAGKRVSWRIEMD